VKSRFREVGFASWKKVVYPIIELGPYDVSPGKLRDQWFAMFANCQRTKGTMDRLIYWYGSEGLEGAFSFYSASKIVDYEEGIRRRHNEIPSIIQKKVDENNKLSKTEKQILKGLGQIAEDAALDPSDRISWLQTVDEKNVQDDADAGVDVEEEDVNTDANSAGDNLICHHCSKVFTTSKGLSYHLQNAVCLRRVATGGSSKEKARRRKYGNKVRDTVVNTHQGFSKSSKQQQKKRQIATPSSLRHLIERRRTVRVTAAAASEVRAPCLNDASDNKKEADSSKHAKDDEQPANRQRGGRLSKMAGGFPDKGSEVPQTRRTRGSPNHYDISSSETAAGPPNLDLSALSIQIDDKWAEVWSKLESAGWSTSSGNHLVDTFFVFPGGSVKGGQEGIDYLTSVDAVQQFCEVKLGWDRNASWMKNSPLLATHTSAAVTPLRTYAGADCDGRHQLLKYPVGTEVSKKFDGIAYRGRVIRYDQKSKYFRVRYVDGDEEDMTVKEVKRYFVSLPGSDEPGRAVPASSPMVATASPHDSEEALEVGISSTFRAGERASETTKTGAEEKIVGHRCNKRTKGTTQMLVASNGVMSWERAADVLDHKFASFFEYAAEFGLNEILEWGRKYGLDKEKNWKLLESSIDNEEELLKDGNRNATDERAGNREEDAALKRGDKSMSTKKGEKPRNEAEESADPDDAASTSSSSQKAEDAAKGTVRRRRPPKRQVTVEIAAAPATKRRQAAAPATKFAAHSRDGEGNQERRVKQGPRSVKQKITEVDTQLSGTESGDEADVNGSHNSTHHGEDSKLWTFTAILDRQPKSATRPTATPMLKVRWSDDSETWEPANIILEDDPASFLYYAKDAGLEETLQWGRRIGLARERSWKKIEKEIEEETRKQQQSCRKEQQERAKELTARAASVAVGRKKRARAESGLPQDDKPAANSKRKRRDGVLA